MKCENDSCTTHKMLKYPSAAKKWWPQQYDYQGRTRNYMTRTKAFYLNNIMIQEDYFSTKAEINTEVDEVVVNAKVAEEVAAQWLLCPEMIMEEYNPKKENK